VDQIHEILRKCRDPYCTLQRPYLIVYVMFRLQYIRH